MICKLEMPDPMPYSTNCNVSGLWGEEPKMATQVEVTPVENNYVTEGDIFWVSHLKNQEIRTLRNNCITNFNNYVTEGVATNALEESMQADTIFNGDNTSNSGADAEFNPMSGMGEI